MEKAEKKLQGLIYDMSSEDYHGHPGTYSSSQFKVMLEDEELFHRQYILKSQVKEHINAFDVGTYFHTAILEPHKIKVDCAVFKGIRKGKVWDDFQVANKGKAIITESEEKTALGIVTAVKNSPIAMGRIKRGKPEVSAFIDLTVSCGMIFSPDGRVLGKHGWEEAKGRKPLKADAVIIPTKVRADLLAPDFILDLKSTTGNAKDKIEMKKKISYYEYDLSAALYLDIFSVATERNINEFIWTFASKDKFNCRSYVASAKNIQVGRAKWKKAVLKLADCIQSNWVFDDYMEILEPEFYQHEWIKESAEDLL